MERKHAPFSGWIGSKKSKQIFVVTSVLPTKAGSHRIYVRTIVQISTKLYQNPYKYKYLKELCKIFWSFQFFVVNLHGFLWTRQKQHI